MNLDQPEFLKSILSGLILQDHSAVLLHKQVSKEIYRINNETGQFILVCYPKESQPKEIKVYKLLQKYDVPTIPSFGMTDSEIIFEDLEHSDTWRLANNADMKLVNSGIAVARWYQRLHTVGYKLIGNSQENLDFLDGWIEIICSESLARTGSVLKVSNYKGWKLAIDWIDILKGIYKNFPQTFNHNDFVTENLALSCTRLNRFRAVVFDYDQFSIGTVYSDWRNVVYSLQDDAREFFIDTYGPVRRIEGRIDDVFNILFGLIVAAEREKFPHWAQSLRESVKNGTLEMKINDVVEII